MYHYEKVLKVSVQRGIICYLRRNWPECAGSVKRTFYFTGAIDVLQGAVIRRPISA